MMWQNILNSIIKLLIGRPLFIGILYCISIWILFEKSCQLNEIKKPFLIAFVVGIILETGSYLLILPLLIVVTINELKNGENKIKQLVAIFCIYLLMYIGDILIILFTRRDYVYMPYKIQVISISILYVIVIFICIVLKNVFLNKKYKRKFNSYEIRNKMILIISLPLSLVIMLMWPVMFFMYKNNGYLVSIFNIIIPEIIPLIVIILINIIVYNYDKSVENEVKLKRGIEEKREIEQYSKIIENMYSETRKFKHDYMNMLAPLKEYIDSENVSELKKFFYENILDMDKNVNWNNSNIDKLKYIKVLGFKAILSAKIINAMSKKIDIKVELMEDINSIAMNVMDLCRITGILMDNAIEASEECEKPKIFLCIVNKKDYVVMVIQNNYFGNKPVIHKIYKEGFSTKGRDRGLGLSNVKHIVDSYENAFINTSVEGNMFIQELWIKNDFS